MRFSHARSACQCRILLDTWSIPPDAKWYWRGITVARAVYALSEACEVARLRQLIARHVDPARSVSPGVPHLVLFARKPGTPLTSRFIEVKRSREPLLTSQVEELGSLIGPGMHARVLRLSERR